MGGVFVLYFNYRAFVKTGQMFMPFSWHIYHRWYNSSTVLQTYACQL